MSKNWIVLTGVRVHVWVNWTGLNVISVCNLNDLWWSMWFALHLYQVCEIPIWHSDTIGIVCSMVRWKLGSFWGVTKWNIARVHDDSCVTLVILDDSWRVWVLDGWVHLTQVHSMRCIMTSEASSKGLKNGLCWTDGGEKSAKIGINAEWNPFSCSSAKSFQLTWWCFSVDQSG